MENKTTQEFNNNNNRTNNSSTKELASEYTDFTRGTVEEHWQWQTFDTFAETIDHLVAFTESAPIKYTRNWPDTHRKLDRFLKEMKIYGQKISDLTFEYVRNYMAAHLFEIAQTVDYGVQNGSKIYQGIMMLIDYIQHSGKVNEKLGYRAILASAEKYMRGNLGSDAYKEGVSNVQKYLDEKLSPSKLSILWHIEIANEQPTSVSKEAVNVLHKMLENQKITLKEHGLVMHVASKEDSYIAKYPYVSLSPEEYFKKQALRLKGNFENTPAKKALEDFMVSMYLYSKSVPESTIVDFSEYLEYKLFVISNSISAKSRDTDPLYKDLINMIEDINLIAQGNYKDNLPSFEKGKMNVENRLGVRLSQHSYESKFTDLQKQIDGIAPPSQLRYLVYIFQMENSSGAAIYQQHCKILGLMANEKPITKAQHGLLMKLEPLQKDDLVSKYKFVEGDNKSAFSWGNFKNFLWQSKPQSQAHLPTTMEMAFLKLIGFLGASPSIKDSQSMDTKKSLEQFMIKMLVYSRKMPTLTIEQIQSYLEYNLFNIAQAVKNLPNDTLYHGIMIIIEDIYLYAKGNYDKTMGAGLIEKVEDRLNQSVDAYKEQAVKMQGQLDQGLDPFVVNVLVHIYKLKVSNNNSKNKPLDCESYKISNEEKDTKNSVRNCVRILSLMAEGTPITEDDRSVLKAVKALGLDESIMNYTHSSLKEAPSMTMHSSTS